MKRILSVTLFGLGAVVLAGCPIYPDDTSYYRVCDGQSCWYCPDDYYAGDCSPWQCGSSYDCPSGYSCSSNQTCVPTNPPYDGGSYDGGPSDCTITGCPSGEICKLSGGTFACVALDGGGTDAGVSCHVDADCSAVPGARCLNGVCVAPPDQCTDGTQCTGSQECVQGACTPSCDATHACPTGYSCDLAKGVCTGNPTSCNGAPNKCAPPTVCSQDHCVAPCSDAGTCPSGQVCIEGGCVVDEKPIFACNAEGTQDSCAPGSICLHRSCFIGCNPDAGTDVCKDADKFNVCKSVTTSTGTVSVCSTSTGLGTECDLTHGKPCTDPQKICIDGYCK